MTEEQRNDEQTPAGGPAGRGSDRERWVEGDLEAGAEGADASPGASAFEEASGSRPFGASNAEWAAGEQRDEPTGEAGEAGRPDLAADLRAVGENLRDSLRAAWTSQERERIQTELEQGLRQLGQALNQTFEEGARELRTDRVRERMAGVREDLRSRPLGDRVRSEIHEMLTRVNEQLRHSRERWTPRGGGAGTTSEREPAA